MCTQRFSEVMMICNSIRPIVLLETSVTQIYPITVEFFQSIYHHKFHTLFPFLH